MWDFILGKSPPPHPFPRPFPSFTLCLIDTWCVSPFFIFTEITCLKLQVGQLDEERWRWVVIIWWTVILNFHSGESTSTWFPVKGDKTTKDSSTIRMWSLSWRNCLRLGRFQFWEDKKHIIHWTPQGNKEVDMMMIPVDYSPEPHPSRETTHNI